MQVSDDRLREILRSSRTIAVIGLSPVATRPSHGVTQYLIRQGYDIYGLRPGAPSEVLDRPCYSSLADLPREVDIDIFDVFRQPDAVPEVVADIERWLEGRPRRKRILWLQEGVGNPEAEKKAREIGLEVVSNRCILKEHRRLSN